MCNTPAKQSHMQMVPNEDGQRHTTLDENVTETQTHHLPASPQPNHPEDEDNILSMSSQKRKKRGDSPEPAAGGDGEGNAMASSRSS